MDTRNKIDFDKVVYSKNGKRYRRDNIKLNLDCIYCNKTPRQNFSDDVLPVLMGVATQGGFRSIGTYKDKFDIKYVVLYSTNDDPYWLDKLDEENGLYVYYGDNKTAGKSLHDTKLGGNLILKESFERAMSNDVNVRKQIPPFFLFEKSSDGNVVFSGLLVPGYNGIPQKEWLTALWAKRKEGGLFQNYKSLFTRIDTSTGSKTSPNDFSIDLRWLEDLNKGNGFESIYAPLAWKEYISKSKYIPTLVDVESYARSSKEQLPSCEKELAMLKIIHDYFYSEDDKKTATRFEPFAITIATYADDHIRKMENTRPSKDGGRDGIGEYILMPDLSANLKTTIALEAKCYDLNASVGVKETSRLISRIKNREFGVLVTTSFVADQAYKEIIEDGHPISIIAGKDIIEILKNSENIFDKESLIEYLNKYFPKDE